MVLPSLKMVQVKTLAFLACVFSGFTTAELNQSLIHS